jgi:hypothetical protein
MGDLFNKVKSRDFEAIPDTYLDYLQGQPWFVAKFSALSEAVEKELATRQRSHYHVEDQYGKVLED